MRWRQYNNDDDHNDDASITSFGLSIGIKAYVLLLYNSRNLTCCSYAQKNQRLKFGYSSVIILLTDAEFIWNFEIEFKSTHKHLNHNEYQQTKQDSE